MVSLDIVCCYIAQCASYSFGSCGSRKTAPFQLALFLPATRRKTKALLQSVLADKRSQKLRLVTLMPPATEQQTKRKRDSQAAKNSTGNKKLRFLNMDPKQVLLRYSRNIYGDLLQYEPKPRPLSPAANSLSISVFKFKIYFVWGPRAGTILQFSFWE